MEFYDQHQDKKDQFQILTFHDSSAKSFKELDKQLSELERDVWNGRRFPFPILLDDNSKTVLGWGINAFPTLVIINPQGKLVSNGTLELVEAAISD